MIDFIITVSAIAVVAWTIIKKLNSSKDSKDKGFCGFNCGTCDRKCKY